MKVCYLFFVVKTMPEIISSFSRSGHWFYYAPYGGRVRKIYVPQSDRYRAIVIPLPRPMSVDEVETWIRRDDEIFLSNAIRAYERRHSHPENFTLEPICHNCGALVDNMNRCNEVTNARTCDTCRDATCLSCNRVDCRQWVEHHPEHAETIRRREDPLGW